MKRVVFLTGKSLAAAEMKHTWRSVHANDGTLRECAQVGVTPWSIATAPVGLLGTFFKQALGGSTFKVRSGIGFHFRGLTRRRFMMNDEAHQNIQDEHQLRNNILVTCPIDGSSPLQ